MSSETENKKIDFTKKSDAYKVLQNLYHIVTRKTEKITKNFSDNYKITIEEIQQLHLKCVQMCEQWEIINKSDSITVLHTNNSTQTFSSVDRFKLYDQTQVNPIESIIFEYNLLLKLPNISQPQPYKILVKILSKITSTGSFRIGTVDPFIIRFFRIDVINVEVEYVDYI
ncbi:MAG: hypothetical protein GY756_18425, partial [bacterium]|nr:hypothetical protein [bacterium]